MSLEKVVFEDDFLGYNLRPEWSAEPAGAVSVANLGGVAQLIPPERWLAVQSPSRLRLGEDGTQPGARSVVNWRADKNPVLEVIFYLNTMDCEATLGFVGNNDGFMPQTDFVALYRGSPGTPQWLIQCSGNGKVNTWTTNFLHVPGTYTYFRFELTPGSGKFWARNLSDKPTLTPTFALPDNANISPLGVFFEAQVWPTPTNPDNVSLNLDWVNICQDR